MHFTKEIVVETIDNKSKKALVVLHGYGQLAKFFIRKFEDLQSYDIIAIQAPNLFYLDGFSGRVGANWMTKENRIEAIGDQKRILENLQAEIAGKYDTVSLCGFSQGAATASRWLMWNAIPFDNVLLYAGKIAPEAFDFFSNSDLDKVHYVVGSEDEFFTPEKINLYQNHLISSGINIEIETVNGMHSIDKEVVKKVFD